MTKKYSIHMLKYIIHMCTKTCTADTDSRILRFADMHSRCDPEGQPEFLALHRSGRLFDDFLLDDANISVVAGGFPIRRGAVRLCGWSSRTTMSQWIFEHMTRVLGISTQTSSLSTLDGSIAAIY